MANVWTKLRDSRGVLVVVDSDSLVAVDATSGWDGWRNLWVSTFEPDHPKKFEVWCEEEAWNGTDFGTAYVHDGIQWFPVTGIEWKNDGRGNRIEVAIDDGWTWQGPAPEFGETPAPEVVHPGLKKVDGEYRCRRCGHESADPEIMAEAGCVA